MTAPLPDPSESPSAPSGPEIERPCPEWPAGPPPPGPGIAPWTWALLIAAAVFVAFLPSLSCDFVTWDDRDNFLLNPSYRGLGWTQLKWMFTTIHMAHYIPITWMTFGLDYLVWGMNPTGYHLTSVLFHSANAGLFWVLARRLLVSAWACPSAEPGVPGAMPAHASGTGPDPSSLSRAAALAAVLFAIHPLRVESVVWLTARRDVVSGIFVLLCTLAYLKAQEPRACGRGRWVASSICLFILAVLARENCAMLAGVLLVLDVYPLGRLPADPRRWLEPRARAVLTEKIPYFLIAAAGAALALGATLRSDQLTPALANSISTWPAKAAFVLAFFIRKTLLPFGLAPVYGIPADLDPLAWRFLLSAVLVAGLTCLLWRLRRRFPSASAAGAAYFIFLIPALHIANTVSLAYDRFSYLACMGWAVLAAGAWLRAYEASPPGGAGRPRRSALVAGACIIVAGLSYLTNRQIGVWRDSEALWLHAHEVDPEECVARNNLAEIYLGPGNRPGEAVELLRGALPLVVGRVMSPTVPEIQANLAAALFRTGRFRAAQAHARGAAGLDPTHVPAVYNLGLTLEHGGLFDEAIERFQAALKLDPKMIAARYEIGRSLAMQGKYPEAIAAYTEVLRAEPPTAPVENSLCFALAKLDRFDEARRHCAAALALDPNYGPAILNLRFVEAPASKRKAAELLLQRLLGPSRQAPKGR